MSSAFLKTTELLTFSCSPDLVRPISREGESLWWRARPVALFLPEGREDEQQHPGACFTVSRQWIWYTFWAAWDLKPLFSLNNSNIKMLGKYNNAWRQMIYSLPSDCFKVCASEAKPNTNRALSGHWKLKSYNKTVSKTQTRVSSRWYCKLEDLMTIKCAV